MKKTTITILILVLFMLNSCGSYNTIEYKHNKYELCENPSIEEVDINKIGSKIGSAYGSDIYKIDNESEENWIYLWAQGMSDSPVGLYKSSQLQLKTLSDFNPDHLTIYNSGVLVFDSNQQDYISQVVSSIMTGRTIEEDSFNNISVNKQRVIKFRSSEYPNLVYSFQYIESTNKRYYISFGKSALEIDKILSANV